MKTHTASSYTHTCISMQIYGLPEPNEDDWLGRVAVRCGSRRARCGGHPAWRSGHWAWHGGHWAGFGGRLAWHGGCRAQRWSGVAWWVSDEKTVRGQTLDCEKVVDDEDVKCNVRARCKWNALTFLKKIWSPVRWGERENIFLETFDHRLDVRARCNTEYCFTWSFAKYIPKKFDLIWTRELR